MIWGRLNTSLKLVGDAASRWTTFNSPSPLSPKPIPEGILGIPPKPEIMCTQALLNSYK